MPVSARELFNFWGAQASQLFQSEYALSNAVGLSDIMKAAIKENLKRRMPVLLQTAEDTYIVFSCNESGDRLSVYGTNGTRNDNWNLGNYEGKVSIIDTGRYFNLLRSGMYISDEQSGNANTKTVSVSLPDGYTDADKSVQSYKKVENAYEAMAYTGFANGAVTYQAGQDTEFVVSVRTLFNGITPNCYNATRNYIIKIYPDVSDRQWFAGYVFDMSNRGILVGSEGNDGVVRFLPDDEITLGEFLTVIYRAADIANIQPYSSAMANHALQEQWISSEQHGELVYELPPDQHQGRSITRQEAADILWKVFRSDECRTPHQLYEYDLTTEYRRTAWDNYTDKNFSNSSYRDSFRQLFLNGVIAGNDAQTLDPAGNLTRAQTCKIVSKALYSLAEIGTTLDPVWDESNVETLTLGVEANGTLSSYGGKNYRLNAGQAGYYTVSTTADKYALCNAGGTKMEPVDQKDSKDVYMVTGAQELRLYVSGESGAPVTTTVEKLEGYIAAEKLEFVKDTGTANKPHYYLFDDNIEFITLDHVADNGDASTTIAHFGDLGVGTYTFFGYHNRNATFTGSNLYYDPVFWNPEGTNGNVKITKVGADPVSWNWNQVWADFSREDIYAEKFYVKGRPIIEQSYPPCPENYISLPWDFSIGANTKTWFSQFLSLGQIAEMQGACWIIMEFEVTSGTVNFDTVAYQNAGEKNNINMTAIKKGNYVDDIGNPTIKGKSNYGPAVSTALNYVIDDTIPDATVLPVKVVNQFHPEGHRNDFNIFTTRVNSYGGEGKAGTQGNWETADDSGMLPFVYNDNDGIGKTWLFDPTHDFLTGEVFPTPPTSPVSGVNRSHLGNYGVTEKYKINIHNSSGQDKLFSYRIEAQGFYVYKVNVAYDGVRQTGENYNKQLFRYAYMDQYDKHGNLLDVSISTYEYIDIPLPAGKTTEIELDMTLTTGCNMTAHNSLVINRDMSKERFGDVE